MRDPRILFSLQKINKNMKTPNHIRELYDLYVDCYMKFVNTFYHKQWGSFPKNSITGGNKLLPLK